MLILPVRSWRWPPLAIVSYGPSRLEPEYVRCAARGQRRRQKRRVGGAWLGHHLYLDCRVLFFELPHNGVDLLDPLRVVRPHGQGRRSKVRLAEAGNERARPRRPGDHEACSRCCCRTCSNEKLASRKCHALPPLFPCTGSGATGMPNDQPPNLRCSACWNTWFNVHPFSVAPPHLSRVGYLKPLGRRAHAGTRKRAGR